MDAKDSLKAVLDALQELKKQHITRQQLIDFIRGVENRDILERGLDKMELFGIGDKREELHYNMVIDQAIDEKMLKINDGNLSATPKGTKFRKEPTSFILKEENEDTEPDSNDNELDILVEKALHSKNAEEEEDELAPMPIALNPATARSQQMIQLIQAIDRKIPLDDYAEQNQLDFDEVLDNLEHLIQRGTKLDINYFTDEVLGKEALDELFDYFDEVNGDVEKAFDEFYGIYQPEEIRLARLVWK